MNDWFELPGVLYYGWVIPAAFLVSLFLLVYARFLAHLSPSRAPVTAAHGDDRGALRPRPRGAVAVTAGPV